MLFIARKPAGEPWVGLLFMIRAPLDMAMSKFMQNFKRHSASQLLETASPRIKCRLRETSKDGRSFWMRSFRGVPIRSETVFWACIRYLHLNPVRAGICERPIDYAWSSALWFEECRWTEDDGVLPCLE